MTIAVTTNRNVYNGDGVTTHFTFNFYAVDPSWLDVTVDGMPVSPMAITLNIDQSNTPGGSIDFATAPPFSVTGNVVIQRNTPLTQNFNYTYLDAFPASSHMGALDKLTAAQQDLAFEVTQFIDHNVLPQPFIPGWFLTAVDLDTLAWAPAGGGGGGTNVIGPPIANAPFGALLTGVSGNIFQLGIADRTNPGILTPSLNLQKIGGLKQFQQQPVAAKFDLRRYGASPLDTNLDPSLTLAAIDVGPAWYNAGAAWNKTIGNFFTGPLGIGAVEFVAGAWFTSFPLCVSSTADIYGDSQQGSMIHPGFGTPDTPTLVQGFAGPLFYVAAPYLGTFTSTNFPVYEASLLPGPGQAIVLDPSVGLAHGNNQFFLNDAWDWVKFGVANTTNFGLQFGRVRVDGPSPSSGLIGHLFPVLSSQGPPDTWTNPGDHIDRAFGVFVTTDDGTHMKFRAFLTTNPSWTGQFNIPNTGTMYSIDSGNIVLGTLYNLEIAYNGSFFDFYVNGVNQGHVGATGPIIQAAWEGVVLGTAGYNTIDPIGGGGSFNSINGAVDSIRLSKVPRHTGTSSFTPTTVKYAWDSDTVALYNFDQGVPTYQPVDEDAAPLGPLITLPFLVGQARCANSLTADPQTPPMVGPVKHYVPLNGGTISQSVRIHDLFINGNESCSGIIVKASPRFLAEHCYFLNTTQFGLRIGDTVSFYGSFQDCLFQNAIQYGAQYFGEAYRIQTQACSIGVQCFSGELTDCNNQPDYKSYMQMILGPGGSQSQLSVSNCTVDTEFWAYYRTRCQSVVWGDALTNFISINNGWSGQLSSIAPLMYIGSIPNGKVLHLYDVFYPNTAQYQDMPPNLCAGPYRYKLGIPGAALLVTPRFFSNLPLEFLGIPISNDPTWVSVLDPGQMTNLKGLSVSEKARNNVIGTFTIQDTSTQGGPEFLNDEPDGNYIVTITPKGFLGSAPASGSEVITGYTSRTDGFTAFIKTAPGAGCTRIYGYELGGILAPPSTFIFAPSIPSTTPNIFDGQTNPIWWASVTLIPISGNVIPWDGSVSTIQTIMEAGSTVNGANWWRLGLSTSVTGLRCESQALNFDIPDAYVVDGKLTSFFSPGSHNVGIGSSGSGNFSFVLDGKIIGVTIAPSGVQQPTIFIGENFDASCPLTSATMGNLKLDPISSNIFSNDSTIGPGGQDSAALLGGQIFAGQGSTAGGGVGTQIMSGRYGTTFYHGGFIFSGSLVTSVQANGVRGLPQDIWKPWQGVNAAAPPLTGLCIFAGINDIVNGESATTIFAGITAIVEGNQAAATWLPPTSTSTPSDQRAFAVITNARGPGTCNYVVNGTPFASVWNTNSHQTAIDTAATISADGTLGPAWDPVLQENPPGSGIYGILLYHHVPGTLGNGITFSCDGGAGGFCFGLVPGGIAGAALSVKTLAGLDTTCVIDCRSVGGSLVTFIQNFTTNVATTCNALVSQINANAGVNTHVTASNVANQVFIQANVKGLAGSTIRVDGSHINVPQLVPFLNWNQFPFPQTLQGGYDGAITKGVPAIVICNVQPFGTDVSWTAPKETQRLALNALINAYTGTGVAIADVDVTLRNPSNHTNIDPTLGTGFTPNNLGHAALFALLDPLLP